MQVKRKSVTKYLDMIVEKGLLSKVKIGRSNYYVNLRLIDLFINHQLDRPGILEPIESVHESAKSGTCGDARRPCNTAPFL